MNEQPERQPLMCIAHGCPMRWSCDMGKGKLCTWHDISPQRDWPAVTRELREILHRGETPIVPQARQAAWVAQAAAKLKARDRPTGMVRATAQPEGEPLAAFDTKRPVANDGRQQDAA